MKSRTIISLALLLSILFLNDFMAQDTSPLSKPLNRFSIELYKKLTRKEASNIVFSPVSISSAFAQMYLGSSYNTQEEISQLFGFSEDKDYFEKKFSEFSQSVFAPPANSSMELINANSIWVQEQSPIKEEYIGRIKETFNTELFKVNFKDPERVASEANKWAGRNTKDKIREVISKDVIEDNTIMLLMNAIYFKDKWKNEFNKSATRDDNFFLNASNKIITPMMNTTNLFSYMDSGNFEAVLLPYKTGNYSMLILLPKQVEGLTELENSLDWIDVAELMSKLQSANVDLSMPSFKFEYPVNNLKESLIDLGMVDAFDEGRADFRDMLTGTDKTGLYIQDIIHKALVEVNEKGTEAAAVTVVVSGIYSRAISAPISHYKMKIDHPFLFFIIETKTKSIMFMGRCVNPKG